MKKILTLLIAWFAMSSVCMAQNGPFTLGYCDGQLATVATGDLFSNEKHIWVQSAVYIPAEQAKVLAGNRIEKIRAGLANKINVDSLRVWIRTSLDGEDLVTATMTKTSTPALNKGWNEFVLETPYEIPEDTEGFYIGMSYYQRGVARALSVVLNPQPNALFVKFGDADWVDRSATGALCLEADVYGDNLPQHDLQLQAVKTDRYLSLKKGELNVTATVRNMAVATINNFKAVCTIDGYDEPMVVDINHPIAYREVKNLTFVVKPSMITSVPDGPLNLHVTLTNLDGNDDENPSDNSGQVSFFVIDNIFVRNVLMENFTTERCPNCPPMATMVHRVLDQPEFSNVILWEHHSGYYEDVLTTQFDRDYMWFYNDGGSTYAPAMMYDRFGVTATTPVDFPETQAYLENMLTERLAEPALVDINIKAGYLEDGKLKVIVTGERTQETFTTLPPRMTVALVEDNINAVSQSGASGTFIHHNVGRAISSVWGEEISWNGNNYRYECTFDVDEAWNKENLGIIAFVSEYNPRNPVACGVANTRLLKADLFGDITEGVAGDVNGDGTVGIDDVNAVINIMLGKAENVAAADLNGDGQVGIDDVNGVINIMLGK